ncbi:carbonic anhydrase [Nocardia coubleae]|uniref:carbonic anhydrase n=1 Tax=Nocardia coubleae TaxID=356147 RepID=A0A846W9L7_9NOCA|nr:carbonic anhydrase family protein [Nocardia coubleae]NKX90112.1 carbonic anhydrase family protein [Nocardia coubleae]
MSNGHLLTRRGALAALALLAVAGCGGSGQAAHSDVHWDYDAEGPDHWADLDSRFVTCRSGHAQSPIDLPAHTELHPDEHIEIEYRPLSSVEVVNNGHTIQANVAPGSGNRIVVDGSAFELTQFHFHLPSEHTVDGAEAAMELHFVHADRAGRLAVLAVLLRAQPDSVPLGAVLAAAPDRVGATRTVTSIDPRAYLPTGFAQFRYEGSLTTPPCTEGVRWIVLREPAPVAIADVEHYRALFPHTNRPVQPRFGRPVVLAGQN